MVNAAASQQLGRKVSLDEDEVRACMDPVRNVAARRSYGGPAPELVLARIEVQKARLLEQRQVFEATSKRLSDAGNLLKTRVEALVSNRDRVLV
jgi:argininosuccinate lyase